MEGNHEIHEVVLETKKLVVCSIDCSSLRSEFLAIDLVIL